MDGHAAQAATQPGLLIETRWLCRWNAHYVPYYAARAGEEKKKNTHTGRTESCEVSEETQAAAGTLK